LYKLQVLKYSVFIICLSVLLVSCGTKKKVVDNSNNQERVVVNTNTELALAGSINFDSNQNLDVQSAILKNVMADKNGAYIGHKMDKLALYFKENIDYSELLRAGEGLILELKNSRSFYFESGKTGLNAKSKQTLDVIVDAMTSNTKINLIVEVHTDNKGNDDVNLEMTNKRGQSITTYFIDQGIDAARLNVIALGENFPQNENNSSDNLEANRRVVFGFYASEALKEEARMATESN